MKYLEHIEAMKVKKPESYDIKTPLPTHDRCHICEERIVGDYK